MTHNFFSRLKSYYTSVGKILYHQAEISAIYPNPSDKGFFRESIYSEFLKNHLPSSCNIVLGGFLFDFEGKESKQLDIIVTTSTCLRYRLPTESVIKEFACIEGSLAIVSVKNEHSFHPISELTNAYALMYAIQNIQVNCAASHHIMFNYTSMIDKIHFD